MLGYPETSYKLSLSPSRRFHEIMTDNKNLDFSWGKSWRTTGFFGSPWGSPRLTQTQIAKLSWQFCIPNSWWIHQNLGSMTTQSSFSKMIIFPWTVPIMNPKKSADFLHQNLGLGRGQGRRRESPRSHDGLRAGGNPSPGATDFKMGVTWEATDLYLEGKTGFACSSGTCWCVFLVQCVIFTRLCLMPRVQIFYLGECVCESSAPNTSRSKTSGWNALLRWMDDVVTFQFF